MYGYIRINKPELRIKDYETYRAFYCTLCDTLAKRYGCFARILLNYDAAFFVIFALSYDEAECSFCKGRCHLSPVKKCAKVQNADQRMQLAADLTVLLAWFKLKDDLLDGSVSGKIISVMLIPFLYFKYRKAKRICPAIYEETNKYFNMQYRAENDPRSGIDASAEPSGTYFSKIASMLCGDEKKEEFKRFGYALGRFIYLADAFDDIEKDIKRNSYNPFIKAFCLTPDNYKQASGGIIPVLEFSAAEAADAYRICQLQKYSPILDNIVILGMTEQIDRIKLKYEEGVS